MTVYANDLKKGDRVVLTGNREAIVQDNKKGIIRCMEVLGKYGWFHETGDTYADEIKGLIVHEAKPRVELLIDFSSGHMLEPVELSPAQAKKMKDVRDMMESWSGTA